VSAPDASTAWDLRCHIRERLIEFLQRRHPESLPRLRAEIARESAGTRDGIAEHEEAVAR
jgi:hypothetical protein